MGGSRRFKNKPCVYCLNGISATGDHVFPREIFEVEDRDNIPKVPACERCNNEKSHLEHYLLSVLPFGGVHSNAEKNLSIDAARRLKKNNKLQTYLRQGMSHVHHPREGTDQERRLGIPIDGNKLHKFSELVCKGLLWHHWKCLVPSEYTVKAFTPSPAGLDFVGSLFNMNTTHRINANLGDGTVRYKGSMGDPDKCLSVWALQFLGGITITDESQNFVFDHSLVAVLVGSKRFVKENGRVFA